MYGAALSLLMAEIRAAVQRRAQGAVIALVGAAFVLFALGFLLVALRDWIAVHFQTDYANVVLGAALFVVGAIVVGVGVGWTSVKKRRSWSSAQALVPTFAGASLPRVNPLVGLGAVLLMGLWAGRKIRKAF